MNLLPFHQTFYVASAAFKSQFKEDRGIEIAFAGRSNAGKSSAINTITGIHRLAKTSKTPGRTQLINFFQIEEDKFIVDLPGYGYAKVPENVKLRWHNTISEYFATRQALRGLVLLMDIRHPLKPFDVQMLEYAYTQNLPVHILLTKADKLSLSRAKQTLLNVKKELTHMDHFTIQLFSSLSKLGIEEARVKISEILQ